MLIDEKLRKQDVLATEFARHCPTLDAKRVVDQLSAGLTLVRELLWTRLREDVRRHICTDPMLVPESERQEEKQNHAAKVEIEIYANVVVADQVRRGEYIDGESDWFSDWLFRLRLNEEHRQLFRRRVASYDCPTAEDRRRAFLSCIEHTVPESVRTPLVLFRLFPRALRIVAAVAFERPLQAREIRAQQCGFLPAVNDCHECHGRVLNNEDSCRVCGNPIWKFAWLQSD